MAAAVRTPVNGAVNVASPDAISLSRVLVHLRRLALPIPHPVYMSVAGALGRTAGVRLTEDFPPFLRYGRGVDVHRLTDELGVRPRTTLEALTT
jgi:nucleoside-diphosphate-sugar epimerase